MIVPIKAGPEWEEVADFTHRFALALAANEPERFVATMSKAKRKGRIFIDWLRNQRGSTAIMPYSVRARTGGPVAAPISWAELDDFDSAAAFHLTDTAKLLERAESRSLAGWGHSDQVLPKL